MEWGENKILKGNVQMTTETKKNLLVLLKKKWLGIKG